MSVLCEMIGTGKENDIARRGRERGQLTYGVKMVRNNNDLTIFVIE